MRGVLLRAGCMALCSAVLLAGAIPALANPVSLTEVRPRMVSVGASTEVSLLGSGFSHNCLVWVRSADLAERQIPAVLRSATLMTVLVSGELTARPRTLEFQIRCTRTGMEPGVDLSEWRSLAVVRIQAITPTPVVVMRPAPRAPSDVRFEFDIPVNIRWMDNSANEKGFYIYVDGRRWITMVSRPAMVTGTGWRNYSATVESLTAAVRHPRCGRDIVVGVSAYNDNGESAQATTTFRWRPCP